MPNCAAIRETKYETHVEVHVETSLCGESLSTTLSYEELNYFHPDSSGQKLNIEQLEMTTVLGSC